MQHDSVAFDDPLDADIHGLLTDLVQTAAPWLRGFPTVAAWDDAAGKALVRADLFQPAREFARKARAQQAISEHDADEMELLADAADASDYQGQKAGNRAVASSKNLMFATSGTFAAFLSGAVASDFATRSLLVQRAGATLAAAEAEVEAFAATLPGDLRQALRTLVSEGLHLNAAIPGVIPPPPSPPVPDDVEAQARAMILDGRMPRHQRGRHGEVAGAPARLEKAETRVTRQKRDVAFRHKLVGGKRCRHDALEEIRRRYRTETARAAGDDRRIQRCRHQAPFRRRIGMRQAPAERAAIADRRVGHQTRDLAEQAPERAAAHHAFNSRVPYRRADMQRCVLHQKAVEFANAIEVDEMARPSQAERHHRNEALPAGDHAAAPSGKLSEHRYSVIHRARRVIVEWRRLHDSRIASTTRPRARRSRTAAIASTARSSG